MTQGDGTALLARFESLGQACVDPAVLLGPDLTLLRVSPAAEALLGDPDGSLPGRPFTALCAPGSAEGAARRLLDLGPGGKARFETVLRLAGGREAPVEVSAAVVEEGGARGVVLWLRDLAGRRWAEAWYRLAVEEAPAAITLSRADDAVVVAVNAAFERFLGRRREELLGRSVLELGVWAAPEARQAVVDRLRRGEEVQGIDSVGRHADGQLRTSSYSARLVELDGVQHLLSISRDVTQERALKGQLQEKEALLERILETMEEGIRVLDREGRVLFANAHYAELMGIPRQELVGRDYMDLVPPENRALARQMREELLAGRQVRREFTHRIPGGSLRHLWTSMSPLRDDAGRVVGNVGVFQDITDRVRAEAALRKSEERFRALIEKSTDMLLVFDREMRFLFWSPSATERLGWTAAEVEGHDPIERGLIHPGDQPTLRQVAQEVVAEDRATRQVTLRHKHQDGSWRILEGTARNLLADPAVGGVVVNVRDVTEQRRLEEQLRQSQKLESVGRLAGGVAHDFNNILTVILGCAEALRDDLAGLAPGLVPDADQILAAGRRGRDLTGHLLAFARKQVVAPVQLDLSEVIGSREKLLRRVLGEDVQLVVALQQGTWPIVCDPGQVEQVLMNLVVNARDAMPGGGTLTLATRNVSSADGDRVLLSVRDSGMGMTAEVQAHLFEPFFTTKEQGKGTGLGLATVYGIVSQCGGSVQVESAPGRGTAFELGFPRAQGEAAAGHAEPRPRAEAVTGTERLLVVEDDAHVRTVTVRALGGAGYRLLVAASGAEALALSRGTADGLDLVVTDVVMPGMSGRELVELLRRERPGLRALYVSGYAQDALARHGVLDQGIELLSKPFTAAGLLARVRAVLDAP